MTAVLSEMKFESVPANPPVMGGPQKFKVTAETVDHVKSLEGKTLVVNSDGTLTIS